MSVPINSIELEIARILALFEKNCERFKVDTPAVRELAKVEKSEADGES